MDVLFLASVALFRSLESVLAVCCLVVSASVGRWVAEGNQGRLGEKAKRSFMTELRESCPQVVESRSWRCGGKKGSYKSVSVRQGIIWRDRNDRAMGDPVSELRCSVSGKQS